MIRLVSYNIHAGFNAYRQFNPDAQRKLLERLCPDLLVLNEVDRGARRSEGVDLAAFFAEPLGMEVVFGETLRHADGGAYGNAILSRFPIKSVDFFQLPCEEGQERRGAIRAEILAPEAGRIALYGTHLGLQEGERRNQSEWLAARLSAEMQPCLLAGDLNQTAGAPDVSALFACAEDLMARVREGTFPALYPTARIDHALGRGFSVRAAEVVASTASDHCPILLQLIPIRVED